MYKIFMMKRNTMEEGSEMNSLENDGNKLLIIIGNKYFSNLIHPYSAQDSSLGFSLLEDPQWMPPL